MIPLLKLELWRQFPIVVRMACLTILVGVVFYLAGKRGPEELLAALIGSSLGAVLVVPMGITRDKMEGSLDFICGLPVEVRHIAASRFIAVAVIALPWAAAVGAFSTAAPAPIALNPLGVSLVTWLVMTTLGAGATALFTRYELETMLGFPTVGLVIAVVLVPRAVRALLPGITQDAIVSFLQRPSSAMLLVLILFVGLAVLGAITFGITVRGLARYRPGSIHR